MAHANSDFHYLGLLLEHVHGRSYDSLLREPVRELKLRDTALPASLTTALRTIADINMTLGFWPLCPCSTNADGTKRSLAAGQYSGHGGLYHFPDTGMTLSLRMEPAREGAGRELAELAEELVPVLRGEKTSR